MGPGGTRPGTHAEGSGDARDSPRLGRQGRGQGAVGGEAWMEGKLRQWQAAPGGPVLIPGELSPQRHGHRQEDPGSFRRERPPGDLQGPASSEAD